MSIIIGSVYCTTFGDGSVTAGNTLAYNSFLKIYFTKKKIK